MGLKELSFAIGGLSLLGGFTFFALNIYMPSKPTSEELLLKATECAEKKDFVCTIHNLDAIEEKERKDGYDTLYRDAVYGIMQSAISNANSYIEKNEYDTAIHKLENAKSILSNIPSKYVVDITELDTKHKECEDFLLIKTYLSEKKYPQAFNLIAKYNAGHLLVLREQAVKELEETTLNQANRLLDEHKLDDTEAVLNDALMYIPKSEVLQTKMKEALQLRQQDNEDAIKKHIASLYQAEKYKDVINYIASLDTTAQASFDQDKKNAEDALSHKVTQQIMKYVESKAYDKTLELLNEYHAYLSKQEDFMHMYQLYADYSTDSLKYKEIVNPGDLQLTMKDDINRTSFASLTDTASVSEETIWEFNLKDTRSMKGTFYIPYDGSAYDESLVVNVRIISASGQELCSVNDIRPKEAKSFESISPEQYIKLVITATSDNNNRFEFGIR